MEASHTGPEHEGTEGTEGDAGADAASAGSEENPASPEGAQQNEETHATETAADEQPSEDERNPAPEQSPTATAAQEAIIGDPGTRDEQQPVGAEGTASAVDTPVRTSPPPPNAQSGVPLPEDRAAGVEPGPKGPIGTGVGDEEAPEHDASEGQSTTPPLG